MSEIQEFELILDKPDGIYKAGETCSGRLCLRIVKRLKINSVSLKFKGFVDVNWRQSNGKNTQNIWDHEDFINQNTVFVSKQANKECFLEVGEISYTFKTTIPITCPTSFECIFGWIKYVIEASIDIPWSKNKSINKIITVISPVDLNLTPALRQPVTVSNSKSFGCCCFESKPCEVEVNLLKGGYVCGERLSLKAKVNNQGSRKIQTKLRLVQVLNLQAQYAFIKYYLDVGYLDFNKTISSESQAELTAQFILPPFCPSINNTCRLIQMNYNLILDLIPSGCATRLMINIPITIGTNPLTGSKIGPSIEYKRIKPYDSKSGFKLSDKDENYEGNKENQNIPAYPFFKR